MPIKKIKGGFSRINYVQQGNWQITYWYRDDIKDGDNVMLKEETFSDNKPSFFLKNKNKKGIVLSSKFYSKHPIKYVYTLKVKFDDGETLETNDYHFEKK